MYIIQPRPVNSELLPDIIKFFLFSFSSSFVFERKSLCSRPARKWAITNVRPKNRARNINFAAALVQLKRLLSFSLIASTSIFDNRYHHVIQSRCRERGPHEKKTHRVLAIAGPLMLDLDSVIHEGVTKGSFMGVLWCDETGLLYSIQIRNWRTTIASCSAHAICAVTNCSQACTYAAKGKTWLARWMKLLMIRGDDVQEEVGGADWSHTNQFSDQPHGNQRIKEEAYWKTSPHPWVLYNLQIVQCTFTRATGVRRTLDWCGKWTSTTLKVDWYLTNLHAHHRVKQKRTHHYSMDLYDTHASACCVAVSVLSLRSDIPKDARWIMIFISRI